MKYRQIAMIFPICDTIFRSAHHMFSLIFFTKFLCFFKEFTCFFGKIISYICGFFIILIKTFYLVKNIVEKIREIQDSYWLLR